MENPEPKKNLWGVGWIKRVRIRSMIPLLLRLTRSKLAAGHWERGTLRGKESMVWWYCFCRGEEGTSTTTSCILLVHYHY